MMNASTVIRFWFEECRPEQWFRKDISFDEAIRTRFFETHTRAARCEFFSWRTTMEGRLAEILILDQFSRNLYRDDARAFSQDALALALAQEAVSRPEHSDLPIGMRAFLFMPFMHSESLVIHEQAVTLFSVKGLEDNLSYEIRHRDIIRRFGRYPHRNLILGRPSTPEEIEFLKTPGSSF